MCESYENLHNVREHIEFSYIAPLTVQNEVFFAMAILKSQSHKLWHFVNLNLNESNLKCKSIIVIVDSKFLLWLSYWLNNP